MNFNFFYYTVYTKWRLNTFFHVQVEGARKDGDFYKTGKKDGLIK